MVRRSLGGYSELRLNGLSDCNVLEIHQFNVEDHVGIGWDRAAT